MPIVNPIALRANEWVLKGHEYKLASPLKRNFYWEEPVVWAECDKCPHDEEGHVMIEYGCTCGVNGTVIPRILGDYIYGYNSVTVMIEALDAKRDGGEGYIWLQENGMTGDAWRAGFTAPGAQLVYIVENRTGFKKMSGGQHNITQRTMAVAALAEKFHVDVISFQDALSLCRMQWEKWGMTWRA